MKRVCMILFLAAGWARAADRLQWRGPNRDGVAPDSPPLAESWPVEGPKKLWESNSEDFKKREVNTPIIADGKFFFYSTETKNMLMIHAAPNKFELLAKAMAETAKPSSYDYPGPTMANGKLYMRLNERVVCFDLRKSS